MTALEVLAALLDDPWIEVVFDVGEVTGTLRLCRLCKRRDRDGHHRTCPTRHRDELLAPRPAPREP